MAMKEIAILPGETRTLKNVAEELKILEGIKHENLVRYYGTLESLVELTGGLPEGLTRRFTAQLLSGVAELHKHGIVHRDKNGDIFLVAGGNSLKLGDFGFSGENTSSHYCAGRIAGLCGDTGLYQNNSDGHGRAADIWSVGCVVVEMASGKYGRDEDFNTEQLAEQGRRSFRRNIKTK
ncbi:Mitogen-activated protein kinase kinase kinase 4 [Lucilia cuprina]|nr:Mitogen-activated protein kinase kinase kinase 4 [Lucilia cuprina]